MTTRPCCRSVAGWIVPGVGLALIPKCPACVAAYVAALTGVGVSMPMAAGIRWGLIVLCIVALAFVAARQGMRLIQRENNR
jgi:hypothetical protein